MLCVTNTVNCGMYVFYILSCVLRDVCLLVTWVTMFFIFLIFRYDYNQLKNDPCDEVKPYLCVMCDALSLRIKLVLYLPVAQLSGYMFI